MKLRKLALFIVLALVIIGIAFSTQISNPKAIITNLLNQAYIEDGDLQYRVYLFGIFPIANAKIYKQKLETFEGKNAYYLSFAAENTKLTKLTFNASVFIESFIDAESLNPILFKQILAIKGQKEITKEARYDHKEGTMTINGVKRSISTNTLDPLSTILNIRRLNFDKTKNVELDINTNQKNYLIQGTTRQEEISLRNQSFTLITLDAQIKRKDSNPYHKSKITAVFIKEKGNIPILINIFSGGILLKAKLVRIN